MDLPEVVREISGSSNHRRSRDFSAHVCVSGMAWRAIPSRDSAVEVMQDYALVLNVAALPNERDQERTEHGICGHFFVPLLYL